MDISTTLSPSNTIHFILFLWKTSHLHPFLNKIKILSEVNNWNGVGLGFVFVSNCEIKPFVVSFSVGIILKEQNVMILFA